MAKEGIKQETNMKQESSRATQNTQNNNTIARF
jgi:hypothetical protein